MRTIASIGSPSRRLSVWRHVSYCGKSPMDTIPLLPDFLDLLRFLNEEQVEYLVIGGMAVNYHGYHRSTGDLDVWVSLTGGNQDRLAAALQRFGFSGESVARRPLLDANKFIRIGEQPVRVEIHGGISGVEFAECYVRAARCQIEGITVPFIGLRDLRQNKSASNRPKDLADLSILPECNEL